MKKEEFNKLCQDIGACTDDVQRRSLLAKLQEDGGKDYDEITRLSESVANLQTRNNQLLDANMDLFLRVGNKTEPDKPAAKKEEPVKKAKYEDLFNEKGELK